MTVDKDEGTDRIPIRFGASAHETKAGSDYESAAPDSSADDSLSIGDTESELVISDEGITDLKALEEELLREELFESEGVDPGNEPRSVVAELIGTRAELRKSRAEAEELRDRLARRQADFENFRKRTDRERGEIYNRTAGELVGKLLPVLDNLGRALEAESSVEATESDEFRHFLSGVDLIYKQLNGVLESLGVKPVLAVGAPFDPHLHEAVVTEETEDYEPDTVMQELVRGYRLGDKLLRPAMVKVAVRK